MVMAQSRADDLLYDPDILGIILSSTCVRTACQVCSAWRYAARTQSDCWYLERLRAEFGVHTHDAAGLGPNPPSAYFTLLLEARVAVIMLGEGHWTMDGREPQWCDVSVLNKHSGKAKADICVQAARRQFVQLAIKEYSPELRARVRVFCHSKCTFVLDGATLPISTTERTYRLTI